MQAPAFIKKGVGELGGTACAQSKAGLGGAPQRARPHETGVLTIVVENRLQVRLPGAREIGSCLFSGLFHA